MKTDLLNYFNLS